MHAYQAASGHLYRNHRLQVRCQAASTSDKLNTAQAATAPRRTMAPSLPATYKRLVAKRTGKSFRDVAEVEEAPLPLPGPNEVLIQMKYAGINGGCETFRARGEFAFAGNRKKPSFALGAEGAGIIAAVGEGVTSLSVGQAVACNSAASFAEYGIAQAVMCTPVPAATPEAVALSLSAVTAAAALEYTAAVQPGEVVLVTAAAGGTGHFAVQLAQLTGARVIAVAGGEAKQQKLQALGIERVIDYKQEDVSAVLAAEYPQGVNVVYEGVGGALRAAIMQHLAPAARVLQVGYISEYPHMGLDAAGQVEQGLGLHELFWGGKNINLEDGKKIFGQIWPKDVAAIRRCKRKVFQLYEQGKLQAWVDVGHGYKGVEQIPDAVEYMLNGGHIGKVVIPI